MEQIINNDFLKFTVVPAVALVAFLFLLYKGTKRLQMKVENRSNRYKFNFTISDFQNLKIVTLGSEYRNADYEFFVNLFTAPFFEKESKKLLDAEQLLIDFTNCKYVETMGLEFLALHYDYLNLKGKKPLYCGIHGNLEDTIVGLFREDYQDLAKFDTKAQAIKFYLKSNKNNSA